MTENRILVTGGAGYIGSHCCKLLAEEGGEPVVFDNLSRGHADAVRWGPLVEADLRDRDAVLEALKRFNIKTVMHFAAFAYVGESVSNPAMYYENNVGGMLSLLGACREAGVEEFVLSSSCATYGLPHHVPIKEDAPQNPVNPYGWTKLICERMLLDHQRAYGLRHVILRYFNAAGADPDGELSERHDPETHLIPLVLLAAAGQRDGIDIFGTDYDTPDGTCLRDYIHVSDLVAGHLGAWRFLKNGGESLAVNLGSGRGYSVREVIETVRRLTGRSFCVRPRPRRPGDPSALIADPARAAEKLGFRTQRSVIETIIRDAARGFGLELTP